MDDVQRYPIKGLNGEDDARKIKAQLVYSGYEECQVDLEKGELQVPLLYADSIEDIENILLGIGYDIEIE